MSRKRRVSIERIETDVDAGKDVIDRYFDVRHPRIGRPRAVRRIHKTNLDLAEGMLRELDDLAEGLNVSRQAVIKVILRQALDQHRLAQRPNLPVRAVRGRP